MEWANGDIRVGTGRGLPRPKVHETVVDMHGYPPARDYPPQTHLDYGSVGVSRGECTPKHCGYGGPPTSHHPYGITHPNYQTSGGAVPGGGSPYPGDRRDYAPPPRDYPPPSYSSEQCGYSAPATYVTVSAGRRSPCPGGTCTECPGGPACEYRAGPGVGPCYSSADRPPRTDLGPPPDIHPEVRPADARQPPDVHRDVPPELRQEARGECYEARGGRSHHASHCDLREFQEWRELRGSRESVGTLPPELESHLRECRCPCDHLGYGNYQSLLEACPAVSHISRSHSSCSAETCRHEASTVYTQLSYLDSPRSNSSNGFANRRKVGGELSTRHWWLMGLVFLVAAAAGVGVGVPLAFRGGPSVSLDQRLDLARKILNEHPLIDGHNDLPWNIRSFIHNQLEKLKLNESLKDVEPWSVSNWSHTDLPRLLEGQVGGQFWVAYTPCESQYQNAVQITLEQIDVIKRVIKKYSQHMELVTNSKDIKPAFQKGKIASLIAIEGGHGISNSFGSLRMMYELGVRYMTLTHTCNTPWATSSVVERTGHIAKNETFGLTDFGKKIVQEMNRLGMMVDLSHVSTQTMKDTLAATRAPIIFSHSSSRALCNNSRNVPDDVLQQVKHNRGIVMVSFYADHVSCTEPANVTHVADHINHIRKVAGIDHVGIGADFDGINKTPEGLEDVSRYPWLLAELLRDHNWTVADIAKLIGENILRVFAEVERVRDDLMAQGVEAQEEEIHPEYLKGKTNCTYIFD